MKISGSNTEKNFKFFVPVKLETCLVTLTPPCNKLKQFLKSTSWTATGVEIRFNLRCKLQPVYEDVEIKISSSYGAVVAERS